VVTVPVDNSFGSLVLVATHQEEPATPGGGAAKAVIRAREWEAWDVGPYKPFPALHDRVAEYWLMRSYDPTVRMALLVIRTLILSRLGDYHHDDEAVQEKVRALLARVEGGMRAVVGKMLSSLWAGFAVLEPTWGTTASEWYIEHLDLCHPLTFFNPYRSDGNGIKLDKKTKRVERVTQFPTSLEGGEPVTHEVADVVYFTLFSELREQVYGASLLQSARAAWYSKTKQQGYWNTFCQKTAMPTPVFLCPAGTTEDPDTGEQVPWPKFLTRFFGDLQPGMAVGIPADPQTPFKMETLSPTGDGKAFDTILRYWDDQLFLSVLTPQLLMREPEHGSRAQSQTSLDFFLLLLDGIRQELGEVIVHQLVRPLVTYNIERPPADLGRWAWEPLQTKDLDLLASVFEKVQRGIAGRTAVGDPLPQADHDKLREVFSDVLALSSDLEPNEREERLQAEGQRAREQAARYGWVA